MIDYNYFILANPRSFNFRFLLARDLVWTFIHDLEYFQAYNKELSHDHFLYYQ